MDNTNSTLPFWTPETQSKYLTFVGQSTVEMYMLVLAILLPIYDYLLTFSAEVVCIWQRPFSGGTIIFSLNRYLPFCWLLFYVFYIGSCPDDSCSCLTIGVTVSMVVLGTLSITQAAFAGLRIYAIWGANWKPALVVFALHLPSIALNLYCHLHVKYFHDTIGPIDMGCSQGVTTKAQYQHLRIVQDSLQVLADFAALALTYIKTIGIRRDALDLNINLGLSKLLLRDGGLQFMTLLILSIADSVIVSTGKFEYADNISWQLTSIVTSHFFLHLRQVYLNDGSSESGSISQVKFNTRIVGNMGAPLHDIFSDDLETIISEGSSPIFTSDPLNAELEHLEEDPVLVR